MGQGLSAQLEVGPLSDRVRQRSHKAEGNAGKKADLLPFLLMVRGKSPKTVGAFFPPSWDPPQLNFNILNIWS